jgi:peptidoglycan/LPS O-acetylase OafA/YrhL
LALIADSRAEIVTDRNELVAATARRLVAVDCLRAIAALMVLVSHSPVVPTGKINPAVWIAHTGVGLFLVLSGFSIHLRWALRPDERLDVKRFWARRMVRLYPTYAVVILLTVIANLVLHHHAIHQAPPLAVGDGSQPQWLQWLGPILLVGTNIVPPALLEVSWSLALEEQLYAIYSFFWGWLRKIPPVRLLWWALGTCLVWRVGVEAVTTSMPVGQYFPDGHFTYLSRVFYALPPARWFEWVLGLALAEAYAGTIQLPRWTRSWSLAGGVIFVGSAMYKFPVGRLSIAGHPFFATDVLLDPVLGFGFFVLVNAAIDLERRVPVVRSRPLRGLAFIGLASYSLYLLHVLAFHVAGDRILQALPAIIGVPLVWSGIVALSILLYLAVERHFVALSKTVGASAGARSARRLPRRRTKQAA